MGGRQSSSSVSSAASATGTNASLNERSSPQRRIGSSSMVTSSGSASFDPDVLNEVEFSEDAAAILQRLNLGNSSRPRGRNSLSTPSTNHAASSSSRRTRTRASFSGNGHSHGSGADGAHEATSSESENDDEEEEEQAASSRRPASYPLRSGHRLPFRFGLFPVNGIKCPICKQVQQPNEFELHLVMCLTKPRITYNEDVLTADKDEECAICLEELVQGEHIARLPCLCVFHKRCIDNWFRVRQTCPNHPGD